MASCKFQHQLQMHPIYCINLDLRDGAEGLPLSLSVPPSLHPQLVLLFPHFDFKDLTASLKMNFSTGEKILAFLQCSSDPHEFFPLSVLQALAAIFSL